MTDDNAVKLQLYILFINSTPQSKMQVWNTFSCKVISSAVIKSLVCQSKGMSVSGSREWICLQCVCLSLLSTCLFGMYIHSYSPTVSCMQLYFENRYLPISVFDFYYMLLVLFACIGTKFVENIASYQYEFPLTLTFIHSQCKLPDFGYWIVQPVIK